MTCKLGINGFGRIGRSLFRLLADNTDLQITAINDLMTPDEIAYLARHDTVLGRFAGELRVCTESGGGARLEVDGRPIRLSQARRPADIPWAVAGVDLAIESTGAFRARADYEGHLAAGASRVVVTFPRLAGEVDATVITGINHETLTPAQRIVSSTSCTAHCLAPVLVVLERAFGIEAAALTTVHAYTASQGLVDGQHSDPRRGRAAALNIIPTSTQGTDAVIAVLPEFAGRLAGLAMRVPVVNGSNVDLVCQMRRPVTVESVNACLREAAEQGDQARYLAYSEEPLVSSDVIGNPHSAIVDARSTTVVGERLLKLLVWYDNEWGYTNRLADLLSFLAESPAAP